MTFGVSGPTTNRLQHIVSTTVPLLNVAGAVTVNGSCTIQIADTNNPVVAGGVYPLIKYGGLSGSFALSTPTNFVAVLTNDTSNAWIALRVLSVFSPVNLTPTNITATVTGSQLVLAWPADHTGWYLQAQTNSLASGLGTGWVTIPNTDLNNSYTNTIDATKPTVFYRMYHP